MNKLAKWHREMSSYYWGIPTEMAREKMRLHAWYAQVALEFEKELLEEQEKLTKESLLIAS